MSTSIRPTAAGRSRPATAPIAYSWDGGLTWQRSTGLPSTSGRIELAYARSQPDTIYALVDYDGGTLYRSGDAGATFSAVSATPLLDNGQGWYDEALWVNPRDSNHVVAGGVYLRQTFDGGSTWRWISDDIHVDHHVIVEDPRFDDAGNRTVFIGNDGGVYKTTNIRNVEADGYTALNNNLGVTQFYGAAGNADSGTIVGGTQDNGTVVNEPRQGTRWQQSLGSDGGFVASDPDRSVVLLLGDDLPADPPQRQRRRAWTSVTYGLTDAFQNANFIAPFVLDPNDPNRMLAGGSRAVAEHEHQERQAGVDADHRREGDQLRQRDRGRAGPIGCRVGRRTTWARSTARRTATARHAELFVRESPDARQFRLAHRHQRVRSQRCLRGDRQLRLDQRRQDRRTAARRGATPPARAPPGCPTRRSTTWRSIRPTRTRSTPEPRSVSSSARTAARRGICRRTDPRTSRSTSCSGWAPRWWRRRTAAGCSRPTPAARPRRTATATPALLDFGSVAVSSRSAPRRVDDRQFGWLAADDLFAVD